ncbi:metallophosphoesterase [Flavobacterium sp. 316]|uniref:metallophosphoesterase n=1 Tax=Flavobacterium sp. 316 TaxID=1603293 RepID=UPI000A500BE4|nr:metallophosphoesterase [Flavobacterium sp. 316]
MKMFWVNTHVYAFRYYSTVILLLFLFNSCATMQLQIDDKDKTITALEKDSLKVIYTFYLMGDAGNAKKDSTTIALEKFSKNIEVTDENATVLFLGDNIYPKGLPKKEDKGRELAEHQLNVQIEAVKQFKGKTIFLPGNHDWYSNGVEGLKRQQEYVEEKLGKKSFLPKDGCPIETIKIKDDIVLILVDSEWYITNWDKHPTINDDCEIKTKTQFLDEFRSEIKKARGKTTIVAIHHPMFSNGPHGGQYSFKNYHQPFFPLGYIKNILRKTTGVVNADMQNKHYNELRKNIIAASQFNDRVIFVSGHEHSLQYLVEDNLPQIISGSGSKTTPTRTIGGGKYSHAANGFAILEIYENGASNVKFINAKKDSIEYSTQVYGVADIQFKETLLPIVQDSIKASIYTAEETKKGKFHTFLWGERYRKDYSIPVLAKTVNLDTLFGGLVPVRKGGGTQSKALRLEAKDGKQYVMRAMKKEASQYIQAAMFKNQYVEGQFRNTASENLVKDVFTGSYPYVPLTMTLLSDAIGVYHLNPRLFYIPKQKALGSFNQEFGDELYLLEEHASDGHVDLAGDNFSGEIISTNDLLQEIHSDESKIIDETAYIKARLFDMLIGDWDRHQDQWRWLEFKENGKIIYRPLPRDRDQAFSKMSDGFLLGAAVRLIPVAKILRKYDADLKDVKGFNLEPFPLDMAFINQSDKTIWDEQVKHIQNKITNEVIDEAFQAIPKEIQGETISEIKEILKARRNNLQKIADRYFKLINKFAVLTATNKDDYIQVNCLENGKVQVSLYRKKDNTYQDKFHDRTYNPQETKEIWIYGLDDDDTFEVIGKSEKIKIRLIGGQNNDNYKVEQGKNIVIYDYKSKKNNFEKAQKATVKKQDDYDINVYDYKKIKNNTNQIIPVIGANPDDGFKIGFTNVFTKYGFERNPFSSQHQLKGAYYFATKGYELFYKLEIARILGKFNFEIETGLQSPNFTQNFFGYGNETKNFDDDYSLNYNRVKVRTFSISPSLKWRSRSGSIATFKMTYESIEVDDTKDRFVENNIQLPKYIFDEVQFVGAEINYHFENYDNKAYPTLGMKTALSVGYKSNIDKRNRNYGYLIPEVSFNHKLNASGKLVLATQFKSHIVFGNNFEFYQGASIGGTDGLRGYRNQRFVGNQSFYQNTDLRYSFNSVKTRFIPVRIGVYGGFDYGRVWLKGEDSNKWNNSYGGGLFINGVELITANLGIFNSSDGIRVAFGLGFGF